MKNSSFIFFSCLLIIFSIFSLCSSFAFAEVTPINTVTPVTTPILPNPLAGETGLVTNVTSSSATLNGTVYGRSSISVWFEYGINSNSYDSTSSIQIVNAGPFGVPVSISISGLSAATEYYYRLAAQNDYDTEYGEEKSFTTLPACEAKEIATSPSKLRLKIGKSGEVTVALGGNDCVPTGNTVTATISKIGSKRISVTPASQATDENGEAIFTITAVKIGTAKVIFKADSTKKSVIVRVVR